MQLYMNVGKWEKQDSVPMTKCSFYIILGVSRGGLPLRGGGSKGTGFFPSFPDEKTFAARDFLLSSKNASQNFRN
jgi:hypothetical protein